MDRKAKLLEKVDRVVPLSGFKKVDRVVPLSGFKKDELAWDYKRGRSDPKSISVYEEKRLRELSGGLSAREYGYVLGCAHNTMWSGVAIGNINATIYGAELYSLLDKDKRIPYSVARRLVKALERGTYFDNGDFEDAKKRVRKFLEEHEIKESPLEAKVASAVVSVAGLGFGIYSLSSSFTGAAIGTTQGVSIFSGAVSLIVGILAAFLFVRR